MSGKKKTLIAMAVYACVILSLVTVGLVYLWNYLAVYESCQPATALQAYWENVDAVYICDRSQAVIDQVDHSVQSQSQCRDVMLQALEGKLIYAKKVTECTDDYQKYMIQCDGRLVGSVELRRQIPKKFGMKAWEVTGESFDLSYLLSEGSSITVPESFVVSVNGTVLDERHLTKSDTPFAAFGEFYDRYTLPYLYTYSVGPCLGETVFTVTDQDGNSVDPQAKPGAGLENCTAEEAAALKAVGDDFINAYVFFSSKQADAWDSYYALRKYMVRGSDLDQKMRASISAMYWSSKQNPEIREISYNYFWNLGDGKYLCDVSYTVYTRDYSGEMINTRNDRIVFVQTEDGLKAESMTNY